MPTNTRTPVARPRALLILAAVLLAPLVVLVAPASPVPAAPTTITEAPPLVWGYKTSWRAYTGAPEVSGGATVESGAPDQLGWTFESGSFDPATNTTVLQYAGTAHWTKYPLRDFPGLIPPGYTGSLDVPVLDVTLSDPVVTISRERADITVDAIARPRATMELTEYPDSVVTSLDVSAVVPDVTPPTTTWPAIPAAAGPGSFDAFGGMYPEGLVIDEVAFSYTGPGGAPDFTDAFDAPGTEKLELARNTILTEDGIDEQLELWWYDPASRITHWRTTDVATGTITHVAFSLATMARVGEPWVLDSTDPVRPAQVFFTDPATGRAIYFSEGSTTRQTDLRRRGRHLPDLRHHPGLPAGEQLQLLLGRGGPPRRQPGADHPDRGRLPGLREPRLEGVHPHRDRSGHVGARGARPAEVPHRPRTSWATPPRRARSRPAWRRCPTGPWSSWGPRRPAGTRTSPRPRPTPPPTASRSTATARRRPSPSPGPSSPAPRACTSGSCRGPTAS